MQKPHKVKQKISLEPQRYIGGEKAKLNLGAKWISFMLCLLRSGEKAPRNIG
jgi:hypothetical protein